MTKNLGYLFFILQLHCLSTAAQNTINIGDLPGKWRFTWQEITATHPEGVNRQYVYTFYPDHTAQCQGSSGEADLQMNLSWDYNPEKNVLVIVNKSGKEEYPSSYTVLKLSPKIMRLKSRGLQHAGEDTKEFERMADINIGNLPGIWEKRSSADKSSEGDFRRTLTFYRDHTTLSLVVANNSHDTISETLTWKYKPGLNLLLLIHPATDTQKEEIENYNILKLEGASLTLQYMKPRASDGSAYEPAEEYDRRK